MITNPRVHGNVVRVDTAVNDVPAVKDADPDGQLMPELLELIIDLSE